MAVLTPTIGIQTEFAATTQTLAFTVTPTTASDTVDLSAYAKSIKMVTANISAGSSANLLTVEPSFSGTTVTLTTYNASGVAATDWTGASIVCDVIVGI